MHGIFASWRAALPYLLAWLMLGLLMAAMLVFGGAGWAASLLFAVPLALLYAYATGFSAYYVCRAWPLGQAPAAVVVAAIAITAACAAALWCAIGAAWNSLLATLVAALAPQAGTLVLSAPVLASMFGLGMILYGLAAVVNYLLIESERVRRLETQRLQMRLAARDAELRMLRAQIDPHFLFNSLNSISALTSLDPAGARAMTLQLADFFRHTLGLCADRPVTLAEELGLVRRFVAIEQLRFGARLRFEEAVDPDAGDCLLPPMLLQPLVENAIKHGIGGMIGPGTVRIAAARGGSVLRIRIENDVDADDAFAASGTTSGATSGTASGIGLGLDNVRQRLAAAYAHRASVHAARAGTRFVVELALPALAAPDGVRAPREETEGRACA
jgi:sensor histidine kinase YesM